MNPRRRFPLIVCFFGLALVARQPAIAAEEEWTPDPGAREFFEKLLAAPSPSGYESPAQEVVRQYAKPFAEEVKTDTHGNVIVVKNPEAPLRVMLAGHCDQIGLIVSHIDSSGFIYVQSIGGWDTQILLGQRMTVWTDDGPVFGVIARKPTHLLSGSERSKAPEIKDLWIDIGAANQEEANKLVRIGDSVTVELRFQNQDRIERIIAGKGSEPLEPVFHLIPVR
jgi:endoglucanase